MSFYDCLGLEKFIQQAKLYPNDSEYDLVAQYCHSVTSFSAFTDLLDAVATECKSHSKNEAAPLFVDQDAAHKVCFT